MSHDPVRRRLVRSIALASAGALAGTRVSFGSAKTPAALSIIHGTDVRKATRQAVAAVGGMGSVVSRGDVVFIKPNIGWARSAAQGANTHPDVVAALVELCYDAGAKAIRVADHTLDVARRCYRRSGILAAAEKAGAEVTFVDPATFPRMRFGGERIREWPVYPMAVEADKLINVPVAKHHSLSRLTAAMKNWFGMLGGQRNELHGEIHTAIADMAQFFAPDLTVLDASRVLLRNGPQGGSLADVKKTDIVAAGRDQVAIDAFAASLLGLSVQDVEHVTIGNDRGMGNMHYRELVVVEKTV